MPRVPWAPLNAGIFLIVFGTIMLISLVGIGGLNPFTGIPLVFLVFGVWLVIAALAMPGPDDRYGPPRSMILVWGGIVAFFGAVWLVGTIALGLVPVVLLVVLVVVGIGAVGYALTRAEAHKPHSSVP